ncbi:PAS domain-containing protein [Actinoplanes sp. CA-252034]|uniref:PAS domain-containing protein n=1 Tax=Actinoplanes sp. CA-252034 TaxID=3239906 RepID=UPI003D96EFFA
MTAKDFTVSDDVSATVHGAASCVGSQAGERAMRQGKVRPSGVVRTFGADEIIVTKTDLKGRITYANDVFLRVSAYDEHEIVGQPHSVIRHPDMPRCVFRLLWDTIQENQEIFAYVVNLAGDGAHYWVLAHVTPSTDTSGRPSGYHSNRRVPTAGALRQIEPLYASLVAEERRHSRPADALEASTAMLTENLAARGMSYDQYLWSTVADGVTGTRTSAK